LNSHKAAAAGCTGFCHYQKAGKLPDESTSIKASDVTGIAGERQKKGQKEKLVVSVSRRVKSAQVQANSILTCKSLSFIDYDRFSA